MHKRDKEKNSLVSRLVYLPVGSPSSSDRLERHSLENAIETLKEVRKNLIVIKNANNANQEA